MKRIVVLIIFNIILAVLQISFIPELVGLSVNLVLAFAMSFFIMEKSRTAMESAFVGGLILDLLGFNVVGKSSLVFVLLILVFGFIRSHASNAWYFNLFFVFASSLLYFFIISLPKVFLGYYELLSGVGTLLVSLVFYLVLYRYKRIIESSSYKLRQ